MLDKGLCNRLGRRSQLTLIDLTARRRELALISHGRVRSIGHGPYLKSTTPGNRLGRFSYNILIVAIGRPTHLDSSESELPISQREGLEHEVEQN